MNGAKVAAAGRAQAVAAVQQPLVDGRTGDGGTGGVPAEQGAQRGRVRYGRWYTELRHAPDARGPRAPVSCAMSHSVVSGRTPCSFWRRRNGSALPEAGVAGITCRCSGLLQGCDQCTFPTVPIYLEIQAKSQVRWGFTEMCRTG